MDLLTRKKCKGCDKSIPLGTNSNAKYCSSKCRHKHYHISYYQKNCGLLNEGSRRWAQDNRERRNEYCRNYNRKVGIVKNDEELS